MNAGTDLQESVSNQRISNRLPPDAQCPSPLRCWLEQGDFHTSGLSESISSSENFEDTAERPAASRCARITNEYDVSDSWRLLYLPPFPTSVHRRNILSLPAFPKMGYDLPLMSPPTQ
ncbi:hypothetical protein T02_707 [Trichinella nativa]|uniref:Uncharacterized protein n=1 Tax=Trichinella nativa TaxID=6335 RepID=A0A0V1KM82_9BILA|nr:hypothetical protein T02_707 [Trichinella nativa]